MNQQAKYKLNQKVRILVKQHESLSGLTGLIIQIDDSLTFNNCIRYRIKLDRPFHADNGYTHYDVSRSENDIELFCPSPTEKTLMEKRDSLIHFSRNGRWGTCVSCPIENGIKMPEKCEYTGRQDHHLTIDDMAFNWNVIYKRHLEKEQAKNWTIFQDDDDLVGTKIVADDITQADLTCWYGNVRSIYLDDLNSPTFQGYAANKKRAREAVYEALKGVV